MDCKKVKRELFLLYVQGEAGRKLLVAIRRHASDCPQCVEKARHTRKIVTIVRERCAPAPAPTALRERILENLRRLQA
ncbi:MAG: hypothetical protein AAGN66_09865 [Acidobacteriota bacterium]